MSSCDDGFPTKSTIAALGFLLSGFFLSRGYLQDHIKAQYLASLPTYDVNQVSKLVMASPHQSLQCEVVGITSYTPGKSPISTRLGPKIPVSAARIIDYHVYETITQTKASSLDKEKNRIPAEYSIKYDDAPQLTTEYGLDGLHIIDRQYASQSFPVAIRRAFSAFAAPSQIVHHNPSHFDPLPEEYPEEQDIDQYHHSLEEADFNKVARQYITEHVIFRDDGYPMDPRKFPKSHIILQKQQIPDHLLSPHWVISQVDPESEEQKQKEQYGDDAIDPNSGQSPAKFLGMKRIEHIIPLQRQISVIGNLFYDGKALRVKSAYYNPSGLWYNPIIDFTPKHLLIDQLNAQSDTLFYTATGLSVAGTLFAGYATISFAKNWMMDF